MRFENRIYVSNLTFMILPLLIITVTMYVVGVGIFKDQMHERNILYLEYLSERIEPSVVQSRNLTQSHLRLQDGILLMVNKSQTLLSGIGNGYAATEFEKNLQQIPWRRGKQGEKYNLDTAKYYLYYVDLLDTDSTLLYFRPGFLAEANLFKFRCFILFSFITLLLLSFYMHKRVIRRNLKPIEELVKRIRTLLEANMITSLRLIEKDEIHLINKYLGELHESIKEQDAKMRKYLFNVMDILIDLLEIKDSYTASHSKQVRKYSIAIAQTLGLPEQEIRDIAFAATLHDIGKIGVAREILNKPSHLTNQEFDAIKQHPVVADEVLKNIQELDYIRNIVRHHHENYDGSGYPDNLKGHGIPLAARVVSVADAFDAMTSDRPYRAAMSFKKAIHILIEEKEKQFDPLVVDAMVKYIQRQNLHESEVAVANE